MNINGMNALSSDGGDRKSGKKNLPTKVDTSKAKQKRAQSRRTRR